LTLTIMNILYSVGIGFILTAIPTDTFHTEHLLGSFLMEFGLYFYFLLYLIPKSKNNRKWRIHTYFLIIILPFYISTFTFYHVILWPNIILQKVLFFSFIITGWLIQEENISRLDKKR
jgi:hypothetical protein